MSFVDWTEALALLVVALAGIYGGARAISRGEVTVEGNRVAGRGAVLLAGVYLLGGVVAGVALVLLLRERLF